MSLYYNPEECGLTQVGEIEWGDANYSFALTVVWKDEYGNLYRADDSGCSCPTPFEDYHTVDDLIATNAADLQTYLEERNRENLEGYGDRSAEIADLMLKVVS
jgi:hypothetical protein